MFPFRIAIKMPILLYGKIKSIRKSGKIEISVPIRRGLIRIGSQGCDMFPDSLTVLDIAGTLRICGESIRIGAGSLIRVEKNGDITLHNKSCIGAKSIIFSETKIEIGENTITSWECQIMDTDTHSIQDITTKEIYPRTKPVIIGANCWIGNHVLINKGAVIPDGTIVSLNSLCNKDYTIQIADKPGAIIGGIPAKLLAFDKARYNDKL